MTHWNYRLVRRSNGEGAEPPFFYSIHEVYYDDAGNPTGMTDAPVGFGGDTPGEVIAALETAIKDARERPVFDPPPGWGADSSGGE